MPVRVILQIEADRLITKVFTFKSENIGVAWVPAVLNNLKSIYLK